MKAVARWLWHLLPADGRSKLYFWLMDSKNEYVRPLVRAFLSFTLYHHRWTVKTIWPEARGVEFATLTLWSVLLRFHTALLDGMWRYGHLARRWWQPHSSDPANLSVMHTTGSFDIGGTQTQIKNLCLAPNARYRHDATEVFPELNYLYRRGVTVDAARYTDGRFPFKTIGRLVTNRNHRSSQLVQIYKFVRDFKAARPDVVVGWGHELCVTTFIAGAIARVPHIVFCIRTVNPTYGWVNKPFPRLLLNAHRRMLPRVSKVIVNSTLLQGDHAEWVGMPKAAIAVCANGISPTPLPAPAAAEARARIRSQYGIAPETTVILNVGRFSNEKGQPSLVAANRLLRARGTAPPFVFLMCGDGATLDDVKASAAGMDNMVFPGRTDKVGEFLAAADIFVMPSDFEGMPNAMMEAMAAGLPCVSTNRSGALDVARPDIEALYYDPGDALRLAQHLERLLQNPAETRAFGAAAARRIHEFSVPRAVERFESILDEVRATAPPA